MLDRATLNVLSVAAAPILFIPLAWIVSESGVAGFAALMAIGLVVLCPLGVLLGLLWRLIVRPLAARRRIIKPTADDFMIMGWEADRSGQGDVALAAYNEALGLEPWDQEAADRRAGLLHRRPDLTHQAEQAEKKRLASLDPLKVLGHLGGKASDRKLRLVSASCLRRVEQLLDERSRAAVEALERRADDPQADEPALAVEEAIALEEVALRVAVASVAPESIAATAVQSLATLNFAFWHNPHFTTGQVVLLTTPAIGREEQTGLLACILGLGQYTREAAPSWLTSTVTALAEQMYESRDFSLMPILGDALQDAGCENADILAHCRGEGPHARGCWVVDLLLGKS